MEYRWDYREHLHLGLFLLKWLSICVPLGLLVGSAVAFFLWSLDRVTEIQWQNPWLLYFLPIAGLVSGLIYRYVGQNSEAGNNLVIDQIHEPSAGVPVRMAPLVLLGTLITHLFGGSAGREGTAVQMGGSIASTLGRWFRLTPADVRILLMCGVAAGFGAVFGTPLTGAIFALEVLSIGKVNYRSLIPCLMASIAGDQVNNAWGVGHTHYQLVFANGIDVSVDHAPTLSWLLAGKVALAALLFGLASVLFAELTHFLNHMFKRFVAVSWLRPAVGGCIVIALVWLVDSRDYLGLGVKANPATPDAVSIQSCFEIGGAAWLSWWWKLLFTSVTVASGFKGGEVTPLFFVGAALGNVLGVLLGVPVDLMAGLGFVAVFAGATNTPLACTIMAIELFAPHSSGIMGSGFVVYAAIACFLSYFISGHSSIYKSQRIAEPKIPLPSGSCNGKAGVNVPAAETSDLS
jgi:H+/Cl- antiporter ClcA